MSDIPMLNDTPDGEDYLNQKIAALVKERDLWKDRAAADSAAASIWQDRAEAAERALAERAGGVNEDALRALAQAYDREDSAQRGEPDPWNLDDPGDIGDSDTWVSERLACARVAAEAFLSALEPSAPEGRQEACATEGCDNRATNQFIRGGVGSFYCGDCFVKILEVCEATRPAEQAVTERKFALGDRVTKTKGSSWTGHVVGFYSTSLTPVGYCVESETETGSVQIYPEAAIATLAQKEKGR